jgi:hypothetical protein
VVSHTTSTAGGGFTSRTWRLLPVGAAVAGLPDIERRHNEEGEEVLIYDGKYAAAASTSLLSRVEGGRLLFGVS